jgi:hypothetical protein
VIGYLAGASHNFPRTAQMTLDQANANGSRG